MDILPTFASLAGGKIPADRIIDGKNIAKLLLGMENTKSPYEAFYYYSPAHLKAVRSGDWKLTVNGELYNLHEDIGEQINAADVHPEIVEQLNRYLDEMKNDLEIEANCRPYGYQNDPKYLLLDQ
jgi:arylsulfatase A-like enzyme